jgi:DNA-binding NarL/FixJ family response regulator
MAESSIRPVPDILLGSMYETLSEESLWPAVVRDITSFIGGAIGALQVRRFSPQLSTSMISSGLEPAFHQAYVEHHYAHDPHLRHAASLTQGQTLLSRELLSDDEFRHTPYYNEYCRPQHIREVMGVMLVRDSELAVSFAAYASDARSYDEQNRANLQRLAPHLTRIIRLTLEQEQGRCLTSALKAGQRADGAAVVVVDRELRIHAASGGLERWLSQAPGALEIRKGVLVAPGADQGQLRAAVGRALAGEACQLALASAPDQPVLVTPSGSKLGVFPSSLVSVILVPYAGPSRETSLQALHELPPSLRRVACLMARGAADKEIACELGITLHSTRTYAARVLKRLGLQSRRALMRCLQGQVS